jgi:hypothetical protein
VVSSELRCQHFAQCWTRILCWLCIQSHRASAVYEIDSRQSPNRSDH